MSAGLLFVLGIGNGYITIILITFLQRRTPVHLLGRMMSLVMLTNIGLAPISQAVAGAVSKISLEGLFIAAGAWILLTGIWSALQPALKLMDEQFATTQASSELSSAHGESKYLSDITLRAGKLCLLS